MSEIKISYKINKPTRRGPYPEGSCQSCGSKLIDPISKLRGYGKNCWSKRAPLMIILSIPAGNDLIAIAPEPK